VDSGGDEREGTKKQRGQKHHKGIHALMRKRAPKYTSRPGRRGKEYRLGIRTNHKGKDFKLQNRIGKDLVIKETPFSKHRELLGISLGLLRKGGKDARGSKKFQEDLRRKAGDRKAQERLIQGAPRPKGFPSFEPEG